MHSSSGSGLSTTDLEDIERATIQRVFEQVKGDKALAGKMLGISRATLYRKLKRYNIGAGNAAPLARLCSRVLRAHSAVTREDERPARQRCSSRRARTPVLHCVRIRPS